MQPKTSAKFNPETFAWMKRTIKLISTAHRERKKNPRYALAIPDEIGLQLTDTCNLRCKHCFQWSPSGLFNARPEKWIENSLDVSVVEKILFETRETKSRLYLWGGEPIYHKEWNEISKLLEKDQRWIVLCTNGLLLEKHLDSLVRISPNLLISIDGFREEHDSMRGKGTFAQLLKNIEILVEEKQRGNFKGLITLNCVLNEKIIPGLFDFVVFCEKLKVDSLILCFPWYISKEIAAQMDIYYKRHFNWLNDSADTQKPSWYSYDYHLDISDAAILKSQLQKLDSCNWSIRIRINPALEIAEIEDFVTGKGYPAQKRGCCLAISNRMDVLANGNVSICKLFPEFAIGDITRQGVVEIWQGESFNKAREIINSGLMPVCAQCVLLYLNGC